METKASSGNAGVSAFTTALSNPDQQKKLLLLVGGVVVAATVAAKVLFASRSHRAARTPAGPSSPTRASSTSPPTVATNTTSGLTHHRHSVASAGTTATSASDTERLGSSDRNQQHQQLQQQQQAPSLPHVTSQPFDSTPRLEELDPFSGAPSVATAAAAPASRHQRGGGDNSDDIVSSEGLDDEDEELLMEQLNRFKIRQNSRLNRGGFDEDINDDDRLSVENVGYRKGRRTTVVGHSTNLEETRLFQPRTAPKTAEDRRLIFEAVRDCYLFTQLDEDELNCLIDTMEEVTFHQGEFVTRQGEITDIDKHKLFVVLEGELSVIEDNTVVRVMSAGHVFGENHMMFIQLKNNRTHRVDTATARCYTLEASAYRHGVTRAAVNKRELYGGFLDRVSWLKGLSRREKIQLADCLQPVVYPDGGYLIEYNTLGEWVFVILEGTVDVFGRDQAGEVMYVCSFGVGDCVGELEFINHHRTVADVRAKGRVKAARLHRDHFEMCMGPLVEILRRTATADQRYAYYQSVIRTMRGAEE